MVAAFAEGVRNVQDDTFHTDTVNCLGDVNLVLRGRIMPLYICIFWGRGVIGDKDQTQTVHAQQPQSMIAVRHCPKI